MALLQRDSVFSRMISQAGAHADTLREAVARHDRERQARNASQQPTDLAMS
jgi:hypothetical protein